MDDHLIGVLSNIGVISFVASDAGAWEAARSGGLLASVIAVFLCARAAAAWHRRGLAIGIVAVVAALAGSAVLEAHGAFALSPLPPGGLIGNRNALAHLVALALPLAVAVALSARHRLARLAAAVPLAVCADALVLTRCRAAWLAAAVAAVVSLLGARRARLPLRRASLVRCALALAAGATAAVALPNRLGWSTASPYRDTLSRLVEIDHGSGHGRLVQYRATLAMAADHPWLGVGAGNWSVQYPHYAGPGDPSYQPTQLFPVNRLPSSDWLALLATLGAPALGALAMFAVRYARLAARRRAVAALATLAALVVLGAVDTVLGRAAPALVAAVVLAALLPDEREPDEPSATDSTAESAAITGGAVTEAVTAENVEPDAAVADDGIAPPAGVRAGSACARSLTRRVVSGVLAATALAFALQSARLTAAALAFDRGDDRRALEAAARIGPGSMYFPTFLAVHLLRHGDCTRGAALADRALAAYPHLRTLRALAHACEPITKLGGQLLRAPAPAAPRGLPRLSSPRSSRVARRHRSPFGDARTCRSMPRPASARPHVAV